MFAMISNSGYS